MITIQTFEKVHKGGEHMKAAIFNSFGKADVLEIVDMASPVIKEDEILVRVRAASVNPKDIFIRKGVLKQYSGSNFPMQTGFDFSGEIVETGACIQEYATGDAVYGMIDGWTGRTCAQYLKVDANQLTLKPRNLTYIEAAGLPLVSLTALQALRDLAHIAAGMQVCVNGASGGVGSMAIQIAKQFGATVTAVSSRENHTFLSSLGADDCIDYRDADITRTQRQFDIFFDVFGNRFFETVQPIISPDGTWVSTVLRPEVQAAVDKTRDSVGQKARQVLVHPDNDDLVLIRQWIEDERILPVIHAIYPMARLQAAHLQQETKHTRGKLVIEIP
jgi:NADPH:quinone reductase-like Zn-dependent oxidoreductase